MNVEAAPRGSVLEATRERYPPIDDVVAATDWWGRSSKATGYRMTAEPYRAAPRLRSNEPYPYGSGKKLKKCCGG